MRLLLIEDDEMLGQSMVTSLTRGGFTVDWVTFGEQAITSVNTESFSIAILDLTLPDIDGLTVLKRIRQNGHTLPVMILTARDDKRDLVKGLDLGADDYLTKPFSLDELMARLRVLLRRVGGFASEDIHIGEVRLSLSDHRVYIQDEELKLTRSEFKIFATLATHCGKVMSKGQLQQALHGWELDVTENTIEVHIHNLRKKLPKDLIKNIRGVGYIVEK